MRLFTCSTIVQFFGAFNVIPLLVAIDLGLFVFSFWFCLFSNLIGHTMVIASLIFPYGSTVLTTDGWKKEK